MSNLLEIFSKKKTNFKDLPKVNSSRRHRESVLLNERLINHKASSLDREKSGLNSMKHINANSEYYTPKGSLNSFPYKKKPEEGMPPSKPPP